MRMWGVLALLAAFAGSAGADASAEVRALVGKYVSALAEDNPERASKLQTDDAVAVSVEGGAGSGPETYRQIFGADAGEGKLQLADAKVVADASKHVAWFHGAITASYVMELMNEHGPNRTRDTAQLRISGIAVDDHGWKIAAVMLADAVPDQGLYRVLDHESTRPAALDGQADSTGAAVARWLYEGTLAEHRGKVAIANGTAPAERGDGVALAKAWDKLKMWSKPITSRTFGGGAYAIVFAQVFLPVKGQGTARMVLGAVLAKEGDDWRWVSLNFSPQSGW